MTRLGKKPGRSTGISTSASSLRSAESFTSPLDLPPWGAFRRPENLFPRPILSALAGDPERAENLQEPEHL
jgi:hypothetical protein